MLFTYCSYNGQPRTRSVGSHSAQTVIYLVEKKQIKLSSSSSSLLLLLSSAKVIMIKTTFGSHTVSLLLVPPFFFSSLIFKFTRCATFSKIYSRDEISIYSFHQNIYRSFFRFSFFYEYSITKKCDTHFFPTFPDAHTVWR